MQRRKSERMQKELLALKKENSKLVAAASEFDRHVLFFFAVFVILTWVFVGLKVTMRPP